MERAGTEMRQSPGEVHGSGGDGECMGRLREFLLPPSSTVATSAMGLEGQARWLSHLMIYNLL